MFGSLTTSLFGWCYMLFHGVQELKRHLWNRAVLRGQRKMLGPEERYNDNGNSLFKTFKAAVQWF